MGFLGGLEIFFHDAAYDLTFRWTHVHGFSIGKSTAHVPAHLEGLTAYLFGLPFHDINLFYHLILVQNQEASAKKLVMSRVKTC